MAVKTPQRLTDARDTTFAESDALLAEVFQHRLAILRAEAGAEARIAKVREALDAETAPARQRLELAEARLSAAVHAHRDAFQKPRMRVTTWGKYGLRTSTRLTIADVEALIEHAKDHGYTDLYRVVETLDKPAITKRLQAGQPLPGCSLDQGEASEYKLDPAALQEAL